MCALGRVTIPVYELGAMFHEVTRLGRAIVVVRRSSESFADADAIDRERERVGQLLDKIGRTGKSLLVDSRLAPLNTDSRMAVAFQKMREEIARDFERTAVVVTTKVGLLQAKRLNSKTRAQGDIFAFDSEIEAIEFLTT
jgi:hypothetical protein